MSPVQTGAGGSPTPQDRHRSGGAQAGALRGRSPGVTGSPPPSSCQNKATVGRPHQDLVCPEPRADPGPCSWCPGPSCG